MNGNVHRGDPPATDRIGPYLLVTQLGSGAMGRVFLGTDAGGRQAAVKLVRSDLADIAEFRKRFSRELQVAERVHSPRVAEIYNAQVEGKQPWLATEYVPGPTLQDAVDQGGGFDSVRLRALAVAIAQALVVIHAVEVVHRDLKPANVLLGPDGPKVIDFGVARALDASLLTNTGQTLGTPAYMSPEQADGRSVESASDVFALGSLLVFAATGRLAFGEGAPLAILHRVVNNEPDLSGVAEDDDVLRRVIEGCLAKEPGDRPSPQHIMEIFGPPDWQPLTGVDWQQPPLGVGLPLTTTDSADLPTVAIAPKRAAKRTAMISTAAVAAAVLVAVAVAEGSGGGGGRNAANSQTSSLGTTGDSGGGIFPPDGSSGSSGSSSGGPATAPSTSGAKPPAGSPVSVTTGGTGSATTGSSTSVVIVLSGPPTSGGGSVTVHTTTTHTAPASNPSSTTHGTSAPAPSQPAPPQPAHNPPAQLPRDEFKGTIPPWFGEATVTLYWVAHSDATGYKLHYTNNFGSGTDQTEDVGNATSFTFTAPAGSISCAQVTAYNQYGTAPWTPNPMYCFDTGGNHISG